jgi:hypothetical protein
MLARGFPSSKGHIARLNSRLVATKWPHRTEPKQERTRRGTGDEQAD